MVTPYTDLITVTQWYSLPPWISCVPFEISYTICATPEVSTLVQHSISDTEGSYRHDINYPPLKMTWTGMRMLTLAMPPPLEAIGLLGPYCEDARRVH